MSKIDKKNEKNILDGSIGVDLEKIEVKTQENVTKNLVSAIDQSTKDLYYVSETDAEITSFVAGKVSDVSKESLLNQLNSLETTKIEEISFTEFFDKLISIEEWYGNEEKEIADRFRVLRDLLVDNLKNLKGFKVGKINLDIYIVGMDSENNLIGIQTKAVET